MGVQHVRSDARYKRPINPAQEIGSRELRSDLGVADEKRGCCPRILPPQENEKRDLGTLYLSA